MPVGSSSESATGGGGVFRWPPRVPEPEVVERGRQRGQQPRGSSVSSGELGAWSRFEREFLGLRAGPLHQRAAEAGWTRDAACDYCPRCGRGAEDEPATDQGCSQCGGVKFAWDRLVRLGPYDGLLRRWIHEVKFTRWRRLGLDLGGLLGEALIEAGAARADELAPLLIAVPDSTARRLWRGIDHTAAIAEGVARATGWTVMRPLGRRFGPSQLSVRPSERAANVARSFEIRRGDWPPLLTGRTVVVIDDVITTGATMRTCARLVRRASGGGFQGQIWAACLARTELADGPRRRRVGD